MSTREYTPVDNVIRGFQSALHTLFGPPAITGKAMPGAELSEPELSTDERTLVGRLMRVDHAGEVAAQGLYHGQALTARLPRVREKMERAAREEGDHLAWCEMRVREMDAHLSYLNPAWYLGAVGIGAAAGWAGDRWSLGFVAETERQVTYHLDRHLTRLPAQDARSRAILEQMRKDEARHAATAIDAGGRELPLPIRGLMRLSSRVMTTLAYWI